MNEKENKQYTSKRVGDFSQYHQAVESTYSDTERILNSLGKSSSGFSRGIATKEELSREIERGLRDRGISLSVISRHLESRNPNYAKIISYYADMFHIRYTVIPEILGDREIPDEEYLEIYEHILSHVDGMYLETLIPNLLRELLLDGSVYFCSWRQEEAETISTIVLPKEYSRVVFQTNFGTNVIQFNFKYFEEVYDGEEIEQVLELFPPVFAELYREYGGDDDKQWQVIPPDYATGVLANSGEIPPVIEAMGGILEYDTTRDNELEKGRNELTSILVHQIPMHDGYPVFDVPEMTSIQRAIRRELGGHYGLDTVTVFGDTKFLRLQDEGRTENKRIEQAFNTIFNSAGINAAFFNGVTDLALKGARAIDKAYVLRFIKEIVTFLNLSLNKLLEDEGYQATINFLPVTIYDEAEQMELYKNNATFGIGKLEAIVGAGIKQKDIANKHKLEKVLDLENILIPLSSSHTTAENKKVEVKTEDEQERDVEQ